MRTGLALICAAFLLPAQDPKFGVQSRLVLVPVTVTDGNHRPVDGLELADFALYDNGVLQRATVDISATGVSPIALVVAVQSSGISAPVLQKVRKIGSMIQPLVVGDRGCAGLVSFGETVGWRQECTKDADALSKAFAGLNPGSGKVAHLLDAARQAIDHLGKFPQSRRILLLISESRDRGSDTALDQVVLGAQQAGVTVYAATYSATKTAFTTKGVSNEMAREADIPRPNRTENSTVQGKAPVPGVDQRVDILGGLGELLRLGKTNDAAVLTTSTGGATFPFTRLKALEEAISRLGEELHSQYVLAFSPEASAAPGYHRIEVRVTRPGAHIRTRPGYWSSSQ